jgi:hypothetical protein
MRGERHFIGFHICFSEDEQLINQAQQAARIAIDDAQVFFFFRLPCPA